MLSDRWPAARVVLLTILLIQAAGSAGHRPRPAERRAAQDSTETEKGLDLSAEGPASLRERPFPRIIMTEFFTDWRARRQGRQPRGPRQPEQSGALANPPVRALATFAGSPFRPCPSSTFTRSSTGARESRTSRPPGQARPASCSRPATGRTATSISWTRSVRPGIPRSRTGWRMSLPSSSGSTLLAGSPAVPQRIPGKAANLPGRKLPVFHLEPGLQLPADRRKGRGGRPRLARPDS